MSFETPLPLNEPQQRRLTVALASLEKRVTELRDRLERGPQDLRLTHYEDAIHASEAVALIPVVRDLESGVRKMADELGLGTLKEPVRQTLIVGLELAGIYLGECQPQSGLANYGKVAPSTAEYLEREIPRLESGIAALLRSLRGGTTNKPAK